MRSVSRILLAQSDSEAATPDGFDGKPVGIFPPKDDFSSTPEKSSLPLESNSHQTHIRGRDLHWSQA
jgi:hypothetical protein